MHAFEETRFSFMDSGQQLGGGRLSSRNGDRDERNAVAQFRRTAIAAQIHGTMIRSSCSPFTGPMQFAVASNGAVTIARMTSFTLAPHSCRMALTSARNLSAGEFLRSFIKNVETERSVNAVISGNRLANSPVSHSGRSPPARSPWPAVGHAERIRSRNQIRVTTRRKRGQWVRGAGRGT